MQIVEECIAKPVAFKVIHITEELSDEVIRVFKRAEKDDGNLNRPENYWAAIYRFHGLAWDNTFGLHFIANYGTPFQRPAQGPGLDYRIIEGSGGDQYLVSAEQYHRYFETTSHAEIVGQHLRDAMASMAKTDASTN
ncbi:hypothetical protein [Lactobacillus plantarum] [Lactiplantibacillus mudanjiangensis]|uniref:hypothetical protein n=1 Tax=Lactiplantibacillus mudanjiangensis TaxID=1296538 RepID=UPI001014129E|nr:hypothetical protein [Lactobacillus plantarum] [Lactiplantibacillus mudanjiangensis]